TAIVDMLRDLDSAGADFRVRFLREDAVRHASEPRNEGDRDSYPDLFAPRGHESQRSRVRIQRVLRFTRVLSSGVRVHPLVLAATLMACTAPSSGDRRKDPN